MTQAKTIAYWVTTGMSVRMTIQAYGPTSTTRPARLTLGSNP